MAGFDFANEDYGRYLQLIDKSKFGLNIPVIHIAGSNGKSSVASVLASIYESAGYSVGLFLNTYVSDPSEMIQINGSPIPQDEYDAIYQRSAKLFEKYGASEFQKNFGIALAYFQSKPLNICIIETGLGGAEDATNIIYPKLALSILTNVSLEHTDLLGTTLSQIADVKTAIFAEGVPVLLGKLDDTCKDTVVDYALSLHCPIHHVDEAHHIEHREDGFHFDYGGMHDLVLARHAQYDIYNARIALEAISILREAFPVSEDALHRGLKAKLLPGHFDLRGNILFDGAENPCAMQELMKSLSIFAGRHIHAIFASAQGQNIAVELPMIDNYVDSITLTTWDEEDARTEDDYFLYAPDYESSPSFMEAKKKIEENDPDALILVTGNLRFVYACMKEIESL